MWTPNEQVVFMVFTSLPELEHSLCDDVKMVLIFLAVYTGRKDDRGDIQFYVEKFGEYTKELNRVD